MAGRYKSLTVTQVESVWDEHRGNLGKIAKHFKVSRRTVKRRVDDSPKLTSALKDILESRLDAAEEVLFDKVEDGEAWAVQFFLKTQGKKRNYTERQEVTGIDGQDITIRFTWEDGNDNDTA